jgi:TolA-binding protein
LKDPRGKLGVQATYRAATTQFLFLSQYNDAIRNFRKYAQGNADPDSIWDAEIQIGEILFSKTEQYDQAILHYEALLKQKPKAAEAPEFLFRIAKSHFYLFQFHEAVATYEDIGRKYPTSPWAEKALFEIGTTYFTRGEQQPDGKNSGNEAYQVAINAYEKFMKHYPQSELVPEARFGIAFCLEELDQLDDAYNAYVALKGKYPSPNVLEVKLIRIRERLAQRRGTK